MPSPCSIIVKIPWRINPFPTSYIFLALEMISKLLKGRWETCPLAVVHVHACKLLWFLVSKIHQKCRTMQKLRCFPRKILNVIHGTERRRSRGGNCKEFRKARSKHRIQKTQNSELQRVQKSGLETGIFKIFSLNHGFLMFECFHPFPLDTNATVTNREKKPWNWENFDLFYFVFLICT